MLAQPHAERTIRTMTPTSTYAPPAETVLRRPLEPGHTRLGHSASESEPRGSFSPSAGSATRTTTQPSRRSGRACKPNCSTPASGRPESSCPPPPSTGPKCSTIQTGATSHLWSPSNAINTTCRRLTPTSTVRKAEHTSRGLTTGSHSRRPSHRDTRTHQTLQPILL